MDIYDIIYTTKSFTHEDKIGYILTLFADNRKQAIHRARISLSKNTYVLISVTRRESDLS